jgi:hypothetical protein
MNQRRNHGFAVAVTLGAGRAPPLAFSPVNNSLKLAVYSAPDHIATRAAQGAAGRETLPNGNFRK